MWNVRCVHKISVSLFQKQNIHTSVTKPTEKEEQFLESWLEILLKNVNGHIWYFPGKEIALFSYFHLNIVSSEECVLFFV